MKNNKTTLSNWCKRFKTIYIVTKSSRTHNYPKGVRIRIIDELQHSGERIYNCKILSEDLKRFNVDPNCSTQLLNRSEFKELTEDNPILREIDFLMFDIGY